jgi:hypothetical protein
MNTNQKKLKLVNEGIKTSTLNKMTDSQIDILFSKLQEQVQQTQSATTVTTVGPEGGEVFTKPGQTSIHLKPTGGGKFVANEETEVDKDDENKGEVSQDPVQVQGPDGMDDDSDKELQEKFESKKQQKYFFAKCGDGKTKEQKKWCKMADEFAKKTNFDKLPEKKTEANEDDVPVYQKTAENLMAKVLQNSAEKTLPGFTIGESNLEKQITRLVEKHISPKMSKQDFINTIKNVMVESPKKFPIVKKSKKLPIVSLEENEIPDWLTSKSIGL